MEYKGLKLDKFQVDAIKAIDNNHSCVVSAPTGSGKTLIADYIVNKDIKKGVKVIYTAPIKALSNQKYKEFSDEYGEKNIGLLTGDIVKNPQAPILIMTTEIYRNMALTNDEMIKTISYVIFDEIHYINDIERGYVWEESIIFSNKNVRFLCLSATIPNAKEFASWIEAVKKHKVEVINHDERPVPLHKAFYDSELGITTLEKIKEIANIPDYNYVMKRSRRRRPRAKRPYHADLIKDIKDKLPCFFFNFSRQKCQDNAFDLMKTKIFKTNPEISAYTRNKLSMANPEINNLKSTKLLRQVLPYGIAFHHAGLIPIIKELVEELFSKGLIKVLYATETFAVGINMPAKTVCFESLRKFDGVNFRSLNSKEYFQIAGRAGRRGIDKEGFVYSMIDRRDFEYHLLKKITSSDTEPIKSQFRLSVNTVLNLIKQHNNEEIDKILRQNFYSFQKYGKNFDKIDMHLFQNNFNKIKKKLGRMGYIEENELTKKGEFSSKIYSDEILTGEIFSTEFYNGLNEFHILMIIACLSYEPREKTELYKKYPSNFINELKRRLKTNEYILKEKKFHYIDDITALIDPCYHGKNIFDIMKNTNLLEGDLIRFFRQMLDRMGQITEATDDHILRNMLIGCKHLIKDCLKEIDDV
ncbi:MAG TPA: DEAD/DEAH box helicase [Candidatus Woesearchaeota archaeon]|jgi:superfamily II RNA helicase|nr:DEAD/DEAH box helicase [Candidatus Woesearchaeota archaeon]HJN57306.1 DEAD/DEAH box helicase [Candidatus Woesearchaeota archaeon]|tara:strand:- start:52175 stop:54097 length:1923 start_codon:yes stop_codon:yes gene_type:complete